MFVFGHLGIGSKIVSPWSKGLPRPWLLLGTLVPDLIDKPLYYALVIITGKHAAELGLISGTRTVGHTALLLIAVALFAFFRKSRVAAALALGMATHLLLDSAGDHLSSLREAHPNAATKIAIFFPLCGFRFPISPYSSAGAHLGSLAQPYILVCEVIGILILCWDHWKRVHGLHWREQSE